MKAFLSHLLYRIIPAYILAVLVSSITVHALIAVAEFPIDSFLTNFFQIIMIREFLYLALLGAAITFPFALSAIFISEIQKWRSLATHVLIWISVAILGNLLAVLFINFHVLPGVLLIPVAFASVTYWAIAGRYAGSWKKK